MNATRDWPTLLLATFLSATCVAKLWGGYDATYAISEPWFVAVTVMEVLLVFGLISPRWCSVSSIGVGAMAAVGIVIEVAARGRTCGCLGALGRLTSAQHVMLNATMGAIAVLVWHSKCGEQSSKRNGRDGASSSSPDRIGDEPMP